MTSVILFNTPFQVRSRFTDKNGHQTLSDYIQAKGFYAASRLDYDCEGILVLTDVGRLKSGISDPQHKISKTYWAQLEGLPDES